MQHHLEKGKQPSQAHDSAEERPLMRQRMVIISPASAVMALSIEADQGGEVAFGETHDIRPLHFHWMSILSGLRFSLKSFNTPDPGAYLLMRSTSFFRLPEESLPGGKVGAVCLSNQQRLDLALAREAAVQNSVSP